VGVLLLCQVLAEAVVMALVRVETTMAQSVCRVVPRV
jgi:hypothetical protein